MNSKSFLQQAVNYAEGRGDYDLFKAVYEQKRENWGVKESTWLALFALYGVVVANEVRAL